MQLQPRSKMVVNMTTSGTMLGGLAGAVSAITLILTSSTFQFLGNSLPIMFLETLSIAAFGLIFGGIFGMMAGLYSGIGMAVITSLLFTDIPSQNNYKLAMGLITLICTGLFFYSGLWHSRLDGINESSWNGTMWIAILLATVVSQRVASYYVYEWSIRKQRAYA